jgi:hypothetical protein
MASALQAVAPRHQAANAAVRVRRGREATADRIRLAVGAGFGITLAMALSEVTRASLSLPGGMLTAIGRISGLRQFHTGDNRAVFGRR